MWLQIRRGEVRLLSEVELLRTIRLTLRSKGFTILCADVALRRFIARSLEK
jgi:hypothetical protein